MASNEPTIAVQCVLCGSRLRCPSRLAGKRVKCSACRGEIEIPSNQEIVSDKSANTSPPDLPFNPDFAPIAPGADAAQGISGFSESESESNDIGDRPAPPLFDRSDAQATESESCEPEQSTPLSDVTLPEVQNTETKLCAFCAESILATAIKCKHCGGDQRNIRSRILGVMPDETVGSIMLLIPLVGTFLCWAWVGNMALIDSPGAWLGVITCLTVLATAALAAIEAMLFGMGMDGKSGTDMLSKATPATWFAFVALFWIIGFPAYLYHRSRSGLRNLLIAGIVIAVLFGGTSYSFYSAIETKRAEIQNLLRRLR